MGNWYCACKCGCVLRQSSTTKPHYSEYRRKVCRKCYSSLRNASGLIKNQRPSGQRYADNGHGIDLGSRETTGLETGNGIRMDLGTMDTTGLETGNGNRLDLDDGVTIGPTTGHGNRLDLDDGVTIGPTTGHGNRMDLDDGVTSGPTTGYGNRMDLDDGVTIGPTIGNGNRMDLDDGVTIGPTIGNGNRMDLNDRVTIGPTIGNGNRMDLDDGVTVGPTIVNGNRMDLDDGVTSGPTTGNGNRMNLESKGTTGLETETGIRIDLGRRDTTGLETVTGIDIGRGFQNMGNTCYVNSTLQALFHVPAFTNQLVSDVEHASCCKSKSQCVICAMVSTFEEHIVGVGHIQPISIVDKLHLIMNQFEYGRQEDAHEFLGCLLDAMDRDYLRAIMGSHSDSTPLDDLFGGTYRSEVICMECNHSSVTTQPMSGLQLAILKTSSISEAVARDFQKERLDVYHCEYCHKHVAATKCLSLQWAPKVLCIQLKRFSGAGMKITNPVMFSDLLDLTQFEFTEYNNLAKRAKYKLVSMITHIGSSVTSGHYTATARLSNGEVYKFDDSLVQRITDRRLLANDGYIAFYEMIGEQETEIGLTPIETIVLEDSEAGQTDPEDFELSQDSSSSQSTISQRSNLSVVSARVSVNNMSISVTSQRPNSSISSRSTSSQAKPFKLTGIKSLRRTQKNCCVCGGSGRARIPKSASIDAWNRTRIWIPSNNRCCRLHLNKRKFSEDCIAALKPYSENSWIYPDEASSFILSLTDLYSLATPRIDFEIGSDLTEKEYKDLTGLKRKDFDDLCSYLGNVKHSKNRSQRNALGMFLMRMRLNLSQKILALFFRVRDLSTVGSALDSVMVSLEAKFVPKYLGFSHITRDEIIRDHTMHSAQRFLHHKIEDLAEDLVYPRLILVFDATYLYIQKPSDPEYQRRTFSMHKTRNLVKPMLAVTTTGYIVFCSLPYFTDGRNNDASILKQMLDAGDGMLDLFQIGDRAIYDRGFRDVICRTEDLGIYAHMPELLPKIQKQFTTEQGNDSRKVTMFRWVVEAVNGRVKKNKMFDSVVQYTYVENGKLGKLFQIACAISNAYDPPIWQETEFHEQLIQYAMTRENQTNQLHKLLETEGLLTRTKPWEEVTPETTLEFPTLTNDELKMLAGGTYQLKLAKMYAKEHIGSSGGYRIAIHKEKPNLLKAKIQSRFCKSRVNNSWVQFDIKKSGVGSITGYYCTCRAGARTLGWCGHVCSVIWYFSFARHYPRSIPKKKSLVGIILDAAERLGELENEDIDEEP